MYHSIPKSDFVSFDDKQRDSSRTAACRKRVQAKQVLGAELNSGPEKNVNQSLRGEN